VHAKTPLAEVFYFLPGNGARKIADAPSWCGSLMVLVRGEWPARWEPQEEGVMSIAAGFPSVKKPRYVDLGEERQMTEGDAC
jgi:hypothetical protein